MRIYIITILFLLLFTKGCNSINELKYNNEVEYVFAMGRVIDGYTNKMSFSQADSINIFLNADTIWENVSVPIFDINGNIVSEFLTDLFPQTMSEDKPWENGYEYLKTTTIKTESLKSGIYLIDNKIPFIIKPENVVDAIIIYPSNTSNAYNKNEGYSLYTNPRAYKLSFHRQQNMPRFSLEFFKWVNTLNYNFGYFCDYDLDKESTYALSDLIIIPGHSEYWSRSAREKFDEFINNGNDAMILSGNNMWWQVRYENDGDQLVCYKDSELDPIDDLSLKTINWHRTMLDYSIIESIGCDFHNGGYGVEYDDNGWDGYKILLPNSPIFQGLDIDTNQVISIPSVEYDATPVINILDDGTPEVDAEQFYKYNLLGFDRAKRGNPGKFGTFIVMKKMDHSGVIINAATTDWCNEGLLNKDSILIKSITLNMISLLKNDSDIFIE